MKRQHFLTFLLTMFLLVISFQDGGVYAQTSASGDEICGKTASDVCGIDDLKTVSQNVFRLIIAIGLPLLIVFSIYRFVMAWYQMWLGTNPNAIKEAWKKVTQAIIGFAIIVLLFGGIVLVLLKYIGVKDGPLQLLKSLSYAFVPHVYASGQLLPNPLGATSLYDFIISLLNTAMKFFLYPAIVGIWVLSGFMYVAAQGAPEKLLRAHKLLLWAFVSTLVVFMIQGFMVATKGTVNKILPGAIGTQTGGSGQNGGISPGGTGVVCSTLANQTACVAAKSSTTGTNCKWSGGPVASAICTN